MSRWIEYDDAIERLGAYLMADAQIEWGGTASEDIEDWKELATDILKGSPSIDIVRCKECRRVREDGGHANCNGYLYCRKWKTLVDEDGYCSWGEREGE